MSKISFVLVFVFSIISSINSQSSKTQNSTIEIKKTTIIGKVLAGYQGWFNTKNDGAQLDWKHYGNKGSFKPGNISIDFWPDLSEFSKDELEATNFVHKDGNTAYLFSSANPKTVNRHFKWMKDYSIDGVFVQRFTANFKNQKLKNNLNVVFDNCFNGAKNNDRVLSIMYDLSGSKQSDVVENTKNDWKQLVDTYKLNNPNNSNILTYKSKAVVAIWGVGFKNRDYTLDNIKELINFFKNDPIYGNCSVLLGVPTHWRELINDAVSDPKLHDVIKMADIVHPWTPGRYKNLKGVDNHKIQKTIKDIEWCENENLLYMPVVFPGFSWSNLKQDPSLIDDIPRLKGDFLWRQLYNAISSNAKTIYVAMFDEMDEGTCIFKVTDNPPVGENKFLTYEGLPSDYYLWLTGQASKMLKKEILLREEKPLYPFKK